MDYKFDLTHDYMDQLSQMYSTNEFTFVVYLPIGSKTLHALLFIHSDNANYMRHINDIAEQNNLPIHERISLIHTIYEEQKPPIEKYKQLRCWAVNKFCA